MTYREFDNSFNGDDKFIVEKIILVTAFFTLPFIFMFVQNILITILGYQILKDFYSESRIKNENLRVFVHRIDGAGIDFINWELKVSNGDVLPYYAYVKYSESCGVIAIVGLISISSLMLLLLIYVHKISNYLKKRFEVIIGKRDFSIRDRYIGKPNLLPKLGFRYIQYDEQFIFWQQLSRVNIAFMFCIFAFPYSFIFFPVLVEVIRIGFDIFSLLILFIMPIFFAFICLYFYFYREFWFLDSHGLTQKLNTIFFSTVKNIPLNELFAIEYRNMVGDKHLGKSPPYHFPHVVAKTRHYTSILYCGGNFKKVTVEECQLLADMMQKTLLILQKNDVNIK
jgi:hypothetical protein